MPHGAHITIVGAGQSGLQLAIGLHSHHYQVRVISDRAGAEIAAGRVMSSQCMFQTALGHERDLGLDFWAEQAPEVEGISLAIPAPQDRSVVDGQMINWSHRLDAPAQSVDQRVKMPRFVEEFVRRGGEFVVEQAGAADLERYARESDLVIVAAGKGEIAKVFTRDASRSPFDKPQRALALTYVHSMTPRTDYSAVCFNFIPGVGEYFAFPALTLSGACEIMVFEGIPGGPMDCWDTVRSPEEHLETSKRILETFLPWEAERCRDIALTDDLGVLTGRFPPTVRHPVATLPSGAQVLGMADAVVLNDPLTGQGSNNASKCAASYLQSIIAHGAARFDEAFMRRTFEAYWEHASYVTAFSNFMLAPPPRYVLELIDAASQLPGIARRFANGFDNPVDYFNWFMDPEGASAFVAEQRALLVRKS